MGFIRNLSVMWRKSSGLAGYFSGIGTALDTLKFSIHTGNPVTDVVLNGKARRAKEHGILFDLSLIHI